MRFSFSSKRKESGKNPILMTFYINVASVLWNCLVVSPNLQENVPAVPPESLWAPINWAADLDTSLHPGFASLSVICLSHSSSLGLCLWPRRLDQIIWEEPFCPTTTFCFYFSVITTRIRPELWPSEVGVSESVIVRLYPISVPGLFSLVIPFPPVWSPQLVSLWDLCDCPSPKQKQAVVHLWHPLGKVSERPSVQSNVNNALKSQFPWGEPRSLDKCGQSCLP